MKDFKNKNILITGGANGIGYELSKRLSNAGAKVICFDKAEPKLPLSGVDYLQIDITDYNQIENAFKQLALKFDVVINNAGILRRGMFYESSDIDFNLQFNVNLKGAWLILKLVKDYLVEEPIVLQMSSKNGYYLKIDTALYSITKQAIAGLSEIVQKTMPKWHVKTAFPGPVNTELIWGDTPQEQRDVSKKPNLVTTEFMADKLYEFLGNDKCRLIYDADKEAYYFL